MPAVLSGVFPVGVLQDGTTVLAYDQAHRLRSATVAGGSGTPATPSTYTYSGDGLRTSATTGGVTTRYVYDVNQSLPVLLQDGSRTYVWGAHGLAYTVEGSGPSETVTVYHDDGLGSVRALTNSVGQVVQTYATDEFGIPTPAGTQGMRQQPFGYTGEQRDAETGLVYLRARMYDPQVGRFLQRDPFGGLATLPASQQPYAYAHNNPVNLTDPSGEYVETALDLAFIGYDLYALATGGWANAGWNALALGADVVGAVLPGATGLGQAVRGVRGLGSATKVLSHACSFEAQTLVATPEGLKPISSLAVGDRVLAYDEASGTTGSYAVTAVWVNAHALVTRVTINGEVLITTDEHPFFVEGKGWVPAGELQPGDLVRRADGSVGVVDSITPEASPQPMWNLTVEGAHTFFVDGQQWLVHNACNIGALAKPGEDLFVGTYSASRYANKKSGLLATHTPHHVVQDAVSPVSHGRGITINLHKSLHEKTRSFNKAVPALPGGIRSHLAADIRDLRGILRESGYGRAVVNRQLRELIRQNKIAYGF